MDTFAARTHEEMRDVLMSPDAEGPATHYYMMRGDVEDRNITVWESGKVGEEYIKTYGHYHRGDTDETYWILFGRGIALLQKRTGEDAARIEDFKVVHINQGDVLFVPPYYGHCVVNTGPSFLVTADNNAVSGAAGAPTENEYVPIKEMRGFAYYVLEKDGEPTLVRNPQYKEIASEDLAGLSVHE